MRETLKTTILLLAVSALSGELSIARGDGGSVRFSERRGNRLITVFTSPTPLRRGFADISVLIQDAETGKPLTDVGIEVRAYPVHEEQSTMTAPATSEAATNQLLRAAILELDRPGPWHLEVVVQGIDQGMPICFDVEVAEALPEWLAVGAWIVWPLGVVSLFAIHQLLVLRRNANRISRP